MTVTLGRTPHRRAARAVHPDALDVVRRARRAPVRQHAAPRRPARRARRRLRRARPAGRLHRHGPRLRPHPRRGADPRRDVHRDGVQAPAGRAGRAGRCGVRRGRRLFQTTLRNPLASPDIVGVSLGASAAAMLGDRARPAGAAGRSPLAASSVPSPSRAAAASPAGGHGGLPARPGRRRPRRGMQSVIQYVFTRVDEYDASGAALADRQRQRRRWSDDRRLLGARAGCCCPSCRGWPARCARPSSATTRPPASGCGRGRARPADARRRAARRGRRRRGGPGRVRRLPVRADRPRPQPRAYDARGGRARRRGDRARRPTTPRAYAFAAPPCPWASSPALRCAVPALAARPRPRHPEGGRHDHRPAHTSHARLDGQRSLTLGYTDTAVVDDLDLRSRTGAGHRHRRRQRVRQVHAAARARPAAPAAVGRGAARRRGDPPLPTKQVARTLGLLPQNPVAPEGVTVADLVGRGRHPHQGVPAAGPAPTRRRSPRRSRSPTPSGSPTARRRALGRPAPAGVDRDGARAGDRPAAARRADDVPRRRPPGRDARPARRAQRPARHHDRHGAARPQPLRPLRRPPRRPARRASSPRAAGRGRHPRRSRRSSASPQR